MKRWPLIRHLRYLWLTFEFWRWWLVIGHRLGAFPNEADLQFLDRVWKGDA